MRIGIHIRVSGGLAEAALLASKIGCETIQIFASNPNAWRSAEIKLDRAAEFRRLVDQHDLHPVVVHTPYLLNLASPDEEIYGKSTRALVDSMHRAQALGASYVVTHIGSHRGAGLESGIARICRSVVETLDSAPGGAMLLLENSAGGGDSVGSRFEHLREALDCLTEYEDQLGVCLDTAHLWGAGYDISDAESVDRTVREFDAVVGIARLRVLHLNDTNMALGSRRDRHANVGTGNIGEAGFAALVNHPLFDGLAGIVETPPRPEGVERDIDVLKRLRV